MKLGGAILAGGASSRMGVPKEGVVLPDGRALIECVAQALRPLVEGIVVVGRCRGFDVARIEANRIDDLRQDAGPLAGIEALLRCGAADAWLIATCDQPRLSTGLLATFLQDRSGGPTVLRTSSGEELGPFPCLLPSSLAQEASLALDAGERSPRRFLGARGARRIIVPPEAGAEVASLNTPDEVRAGTHRRR